MESRFQTSFIPKKPIESSGGTTITKRVRPPSILRLIAVFIFLISLALWGGVILWKVYLNNRIQSDQASLTASQKEFDLGTVTTLTRLNNRLTAAGGIISGHLALSQLFNELENITLKNIRFTDMTLAYAGAEKGLTLTLKGQATSYAAVAKQSDAFNQNRDFHSPIFSDLNLDATGQIIFTITTSIDPKSFLYTADNNAPSTVTPQ